MGVFKLPSLNHKSVAENVALTQEEERKRREEEERRAQEEAERKAKEEAEQRKKDERATLEMIKSRIPDIFELDDFTVCEDYQRTTFNFLEKCSQQEDNDVEISLRSFVKLALVLDESSLDEDDYDEKDAIKLLKDASVNFKASANDIASRRKLIDDIVKLLKKGKTDLNSVDVSRVTEMSVLFFEINQEVKVEEIDISRWDVSHVTDMSCMFMGCKDLKCNLSKWDVSHVTDMRYMFLNCENFNSDLARWDVSSVTDMRYMFFTCNNFNSDLSRWDVSNVTNMRCMFDECENFNSDLSRWDVSSVTDMSSMFDECENFNSDLSRWDVSSVTNMRYMFYCCFKFNSDLSRWDVSRVTDMYGMFDGCDFNQDLSNWDVSSVTDDDHIFDGCLYYNIDLSRCRWYREEAERKAKEEAERKLREEDEVCNAKEDDSFDVVLNAAGFQILLVIKKVKELCCALDLKAAKDLVCNAPSVIKEGVSKIEAENFKKQLEELGAKVELINKASAHNEVCNAKESDTFDVVLKSPGGEKLKVIKLVMEICGLGLKDAKDLVDDAPCVIKEGGSKVEAENFKEQLEELGATVELINKTSAHNEVCNAKESDTFDVVLKSPGGEKLKVIKLVMEICGLGLKDAKDLVDDAPCVIKEGGSKVEAENFKKQLEELGATVELINKTSVHNEEAEHKFAFSPKTKEELKEIIIKLLKHGETDLNSIDVSHITDMSSLFHDIDDEVSVKNINISKWDVSRVTDMSSMFYGCDNFNSDLSRWDVSHVTNMKNMFSGSGLLFGKMAFNADLSRWDVSRVTDMHSMFYGWENFNSDLSRWDVSSVTDMNGMFYGCKEFRSNLSRWDVSSVTDMHDMFNDCSNFNSDLSGWNVSNVINMNSMFYGCENFDSDLSDWDVSNVLANFDMFDGCKKLAKKPRWYKE